ncbi:MAG: ABC transporter permease [Flammeovirgaceae bacterium]|nr:ABC transporter permease [Flammeovirgaceae bacterium]
MLLNYLKLSLRLMARNPFFTLINIAGLSVGFTVFIILWQYAQNELRSDQQWEDSSRIARVGLLHEWSDDKQTWESEKYGTTWAAFSMQLVQDFPELETYTRILPSTNFNESLAGLNRDIIVSYERPDQTAVKMLEEKVVMADANVFEFFNISLIKGNSKKALAGGSSVSIAESIAKKYFGDEEPLGKTLLIDNLPFEVTGIFPDFQSNTHLNFQLAISNQSKLNNWNTSLVPPPKVTSYVKSKEQVDWEEFERKINTTVMIEKYYGNMMRQFKTKEQTLVQPLHEISFSQNWRGDQFEPKSKKNY